MEFEYSFFKHLTKRYFKSINLHEFSLHNEKQIMRNLPESTVHRLNKNSVVLLGSGALAK